MIRTIIISTNDIIPEEDISKHVSITVNTSTYTGTIKAICVEDNEKTFTATGEITIGD